MAKKFKYAIVGSGLFGATLANILTSKGHQVIVLEEKSVLGGAVRTDVMDESRIPVHTYGPHIFHTSNKKVWDFINRFSTMIPFVNSPIAVASNNEIYHLPFNMDTFYKIYKTTDVDKLKELIDNDKTFTGSPDDNLENKAISLVGKRIYDLLVKEYTEKQWGRQCKDLPSDIITRLPLRFTWNNNYFNDIYQGIPYEGYTYIIDKLLSQSYVITDTKVTHDNLAAIKSIADTIIYTGRLDDFYNGSLGWLDYRGLRFEHQPCLVSQGTAVINYTSWNVPYTRVTEHKYFYPLMNPESISGGTKTYEYSADPKECGNYFYPINTERNKTLHDEYIKLSRRDGIYIGGRLATYRYINMDKAIEEAMSMANDLLMIGDR